MSKVKLHNVVYNGETGTFEARVDIQRGETTFRYPCQLTAPETMDLDTVCEQLTQQAVRMSDSGAEFRSRF